MRRTSWNEDRAVELPGEQISTGQMQVTNVQSWGQVRVNVWRLISDQTAAERWKGQADARQRGKRELDPAPTLCQHRWQREM